MKEELLPVRRSFNGLPSGRLGRSGWTLGRNCWGDSWNLKMDALSILSSARRTTRTTRSTRRGDPNPWSRILEPWSICKSRGSEHPASAQRDNPHLDCVRCPCFFLGSERWHFYSS